MTEIKEQKKQQKEIADKLGKHWNDTDIPWNANYISPVTNPDYYIKKGV